MLLKGRERSEGQIGKSPRTSGQPPTNRESPRKDRKEHTGTGETQLGNLPVCNTPVWRPLKVETQTLRCQVLSQISNRKLSRDPVAMTILFRTEMFKRGPTNHHNTNPRPGRKGLLSPFSREFEEFSLETIGEFGLNAGSRTKFELARFCVAMVVHLASA